MAKVKFEDALKRLEEIVEALEQEDLALDTSLKYFEEGVNLSRVCMQQLDEAEKKIEILVRKQNGEFETKPFNVSESSEAS